MTDESDGPAAPNPEARDAGNPRKEKVLHTRVPDGLAEELKRLAESMRVPVSNVVRSVLEDAVDAVSAVGEKVDWELRDLSARLDEKVDVGLRGLAARLDEQGRNWRTSPRAERSPAPEPPAAPLAGVIGFQPMLLAQDATCTLTGRALRAGDQAYLGIRQGDGPLVIVAPEAVPVNLAPSPGSSDD